MWDRDPVEVYNNALVPMVVEQTSRGERAFDIFSRLLQDRIISWKYVKFMSSEEAMATDTVSLSITNQELHDLLGDCALLLSDAVWANRENQVRKLIVGRVMSQFSFAEVPVSPMEEAPAIMAVRAAASVATAAA